MPRKRTPAQQAALEGMPEGAGTFAGYPIEELRLGVLGASQLPITEKLAPGDEVEVTFRGRIVKHEHSIRTRASRQGGQQYARERVVLNVDTAMKIESLGPPEPEDESNEE